jgi:RNA polymerase sigma-70 factor (ECF subfamily)
LTTPFVDADDRLLIEAAQKDPRRFAELYERNFERVYSYVARRVQDRATAEDLTADVFRSALENLPRFEWRGVPFAGWLYRMASNAIVDRAKRSARESKDPAPEPAVEPSVPDLDAAETRAQLFQGVRGLPEDQRRVVLRRFVEQWSIREIANELGRSEGAVKQLQFRALETLRARMSGRHG